MRFTLRSLTPSDYPALRAVYDATMAPGGGEFPEDPDQYNWMGAFYGEILAGFGGYHIAPPVLTLTETGVLPEYRGHNLQTKGMLYILEHAHETGCTVAHAKCNARSIASMRSIVQAGFVPYANSEYAGHTFVLWELPLDR